jgi:hypothetical protein
MRRSTRTDWESIGTTPPVRMREKLGQVVIVRCLWSCGTGVAPCDASYEGCASFTISQCCWKSGTASPLAGGHATLAAHDATDNGLRSHDAGNAIGRVGRPEGARLFRKPRNTVLVAVAACGGFGTAKRFKPWVHGSEEGSRVLEAPESIPQCTALVQRITRAHR